MFEWLLAAAGNQGDVVPPVFQAVGTGVASASSISVAWPTHEEGDIGFLFFSRDGSYGTPPATPSGWIPVGSYGNPGRTLSVYYRRATSSAMPNASITDSDCYGVIMTVRGALSDSNPYEIISNGSLTSSTSHTLGGGESTTDGSLILIAMANGGAAAANTTSITNADIEDLTERFDAGTTVDNDTHITLATGSKASAGLIGDTSVSLSASYVLSYLKLSIGGDGGEPKYPPLEFGFIGNQSVPSAVVPPAHEVGDLMILQFMDDGTGQIDTAPAGWSGPINVSTESTRRISMIWKIAQSSSEPSVDLTGLVTSSGSKVAWIFTVRGAHPTNPINAQQASARTTASTSLSIDGLTTTVDGCLILSFSTHTSDTSVALFSGWANASLVSTTELFDFSSTTGNGKGFAFAGGIKSSAGVVGSTTGTISLSNTGNQLMLAIAPAL